MSLSRKDAEFLFALAQMVGPMGPSGYRGAEEAQRRASRLLQAIEDDPLPSADEVRAWHLTRDETPPPRRRFWEFWKRGAE